MPDLPSNVQGVYRILQPKAQTVPVVFDSPHSGTIYPDDYGYACDLSLLRRTEDRFVDELYANAPDFGAPFLAAEFARSYIDVNRAEDDIDPDLLESDWPTTYSPSFRSAAGHGIVHRLIKVGYPIYNRRLTISEVEDRIAHYYRPYHAMLKKLLDDTHYNFGQVWHINCHSMNSLRPRDGAVISLGEADFVLGDRDGTTCDPEFTRHVRDFLNGLGYKVSINTPYKGAELLRRYSDPMQGRHGLQIEINKALYLNEDTQEKNKKYGKLKDNLDRLCEFITDWAGAQKLSQAAD